MCSGFVYDFRYTIIKIKYWHCPKSQHMRWHSLKKNTSSNPFVHFIVQAVVDLNIDHMEGSKHLKKMAKKQYFFFRCVNQRCFNMKRFKGSFFFYWNWKKKCNFLLANVQCAAAWQCHDDTMGACLSSNLRWIPVAHIELIRWHVGWKCFYSQQ